MCTLGVCHCVSSCMHVRLSVWPCYTLVFIDDATSVKPTNFLSSTPYLQNTRSTCFSKTTGKFIITLARYNSALEKFFKNCAFVHNS